MSRTRHDETTHNAQYTRKYELLIIVSDASNQKKRDNQAEWMSLFVVRTYGDDISTGSYAIYLQ